MCFRRRVDGYWPDGFQGTLHIRRGYTREAIAIDLSAAGPGIAVSKERVSVLSVSSTGPDLIVVFQVKLSL